MTGLQTDSFLPSSTKTLNNNNGDTKFFSEIFLREEIYLKIEFYSI